VELQHLTEVCKNNNTTLEMTTKAKQQHKTYKAQSFGVLELSVQFHELTWKTSLSM
jgi:hypothetical protein